MLGVGLGSERCALGRFEQTIGRPCLKAVIQRYVETVEHFGLWLRRRGISIRQINERCFRQFLCNHLPRCRCPKPAPKIMENCRPALGRLRDVLRERKLIPPAKPEGIRFRPLDQLIVAYDQHMNQVCGLSVSTRRTRQGYARQLLQWLFGRRRICLRQLAPKDLVGFVTSRVPGLKSGSSQALVVGLRSFLRFLELSGRVHLRLSAAVPHLPPLPLHQPPKTLEWRQ
jgi:hypothetical protein